MRDFKCQCTGNLQALTNDWQTYLRNFDSICQLPLLKERFIFRNYHRQCHDKHDWRTIFCGQHSIADHYGQQVIHSQWPSTKMESDSEKNNQRHTVRLSNLALIVHLSGGLQFYKFNWYRWILIKVSKKTFIHLHLNVKSSFKKTCKSCRKISVHR